MPEHDPGLQAHDTMPTTLSEVRRARMHPRRRKLDIRNIDISQSLEIIHHFGGRAQILRHAQFLAIFTAE